MVLVEYKKGSENPFRKYPHLKSIWEQNGIQDRVENSIDKYNDSDEENGKIFLIKMSNQIIGITGYYFTDDANCIGLRWHGIVPNMRAKGRSTEALNLLWDYLRENDSSVKYVQEFARQDDIRAIEYFEKIGFKKVEPSAKINNQYHPEIKSFKMIKII